MATYDLTVAPYRLSAGFSGVETVSGSNYRKFLGSDLKTLKDGTVPSGSNTFKFAKLQSGVMISQLYQIVADADDTSIKPTIGYTDGTNTDVDFFIATGTDADLDTAGIYKGVDKMVIFPKSAGYTYTPYLTFTLDVDNLDDATEFMILWNSLLINETFATSLTAPLTDLV
jgi:hypothetical protein